MVVVGNVSIVVGVAVIVTNGGGGGSRCGPCGRWLYRDHHENIFVNLDPVKYHRYANISK